MAATNYDIIINGVKAKLARDQEGASYKRTTVRREVQNNVLTQSDNPALQSRPDRPALYQTDWAGGSRWWKPLLQGDEINSYFKGNGMDAWSEPGKIIPGNKLVETELVSSTPSLGDFRTEVSGDSPAAYWQFEDAAAAADSSGNSRTLTWAVGPTATEQAGVTTDDESVEFDGVDDRASVSAPNQGIFNRTANGQDLSVEAWLFPTGGTGIVAESLTRSDANKVINWRVTRYSDGSIGFQWTNDGAGFGDPDVIVSASRTAAGVVPNNQWTHVVLRFAQFATSRTARVYVNGVAVKAEAVSFDPPPSGTARFTIGASWNGIEYGNRFKGFISELAIYFDMLANQEVADHFAAYLDTLTSTLQQNCVVGLSSAGIYAIGGTSLTDSTNLDIYKWTPASDSFVRQTGYTSGIAAADAPLAVTYDASDGFFYNVSEAGHVERWNPATPATSANWITSGLNVGVGTSIFRGSADLLIYDGEKLFKVTKSGPSVSVAYADGLGPDFLDGADLTKSSKTFTTLNLAVSTTEGIYYVKNVAQGNQPVPWVFRVDRDASGAYIGNPIGQLPVGLVALDITHHLGQVLISATPHWQAVLNNEGSPMEIQIFFAGGQGLGTLGSPQGDREQVDEAPYVFAGSEGRVVYLAGANRLWVYDAVRGGIHAAGAWPTPSTIGPFKFVIEAEDSDGDLNLLSLAPNKFTLVKRQVDDPHVVTDFGDDETSHVLESNYFDAGVPMETKEISKVAIDREPGDGQQEWSVWVAADDGEFIEVLSHSAVDAGYSEAVVTPISGRRFRYRVIYQTTTAVRNALKALLVYMTTGEMVTEWDVVLDGSQLLNVDNAPIKEEDFYNDMVTLGDGPSIVTFIDNMQEHDQEQDTGGSGVDVKVVAVEIMKEKPGESQVRLLLREA